MNYPNRRSPLNQQQWHLVNPDLLPSDHGRELDIVVDMYGLMGPSKWVRGNDLTANKRVKPPRATYRVFPDFEVDLADGGLEYVDVKFASALRDPVVKARMAHTAKYLASKGIRYRVVTDKEIRRNRLLLEHLMLLKAWRHRGVYAVSELKQMVPKGPVSFGALQERLGSPVPVIELIANQMVFCDLESPISLSTMLRPMRSDDHAMLY